MKNVFYIVIFLVAILTGCEPPVTFTEPQPVDTENLIKFPKRLQGQYFNLEDNSILIIEDALIQRVYNLEEKVHINQVDNSLQINGDTIINLATNDKSIIYREEDSLITHIHYTDTLFKIDNKNVVRKWKGYYFLSTCYDETSWEVKKVQLSKGQLFLSNISSELEMENLKEMAEMPDDTIPPFKIAATKKSFKKFVKNNGFANVQIFVKQN